MPSSRPASAVIRDPDPGDLVLPAAWAPPARPPLPLAAAAVPVAGALALWLVTGSPFALLFAALGPLLAVASVVDARRASCRDRRRAEAAAGRACERVAEAVRAQHDSERARLWARHPDVAGFLRRGDAIWRGRPAEAELLVVGAGTIPSGVRVAGGEGDERAARIRAAADRLDDAPVTVPAASGLAVVGGVAAEAAHRALAVQLLLTRPPGRLRVLPREDDAFGWAAAVPHRSGELALALVRGEEPVPPGADIVLALLAPGDAPPPECAAVLTVHDPASAVLDVDGTSRSLRVEALSADQAASVVALLADRAVRTLGIVDDGEDPVAFADLPIAHNTPGTLAAVIGLSGGRPCEIDLVADGPHAVVAGVTGSGKSELLITWIAALAATRSTTEVTFLLADFKGGSAFDGLAGLPHVTGVITDLDGTGARRAIESLRAELRRREAELARCGARDIGDPRVRMPRLVIVIDEFAALLGDHPELHAVFADVAARGRALGLHLILGTQRVAGVVRDGLLANCPLRISLRVTDPTDSRAVIGTDDAARLPGDAAGRGIALVRRGSDDAPRRTRIGLCSADDIRTVAARSDGPPPRASWLPPLPADVPLVAAETAAMGRGILALGLVDEPEQQRQRVIGIGVRDRGLAVVGAAGCGRSTALETLAVQAEHVTRVTGAPEAAWDAVAELMRAAPADGTLVVIDDLDALLGRYPQDYALELVARLESILRGAGEGGYLVAVAAQRLTGPVSRLVELLPHRLILPTASASEHAAAGGASADFVPGAPPGRGSWRGSAIQVFRPPPAPARPPAPAVSPWHPDAPLTGIVVRGSRAAVAAGAAWPHAVVRSLDDYVADPSIAGDAPLVLVGDPEDWQRHWRVLGAARADHDLVIDLSCAADYRVLTGSRELPPYAEPGRAWLRRAGGDAVRIVLPRASAGRDAPRSSLTARTADPSVGM